MLPLVCCSVVCKVALKAWHTDLSGVKPSLQHVGNEAEKHANSCSLCLIYGRLVMRMKTGGAASLYQSFHGSRSYNNELIRRHDLNTWPSSPWNNPYPKLKVWSYYRQKWPKFQCISLNTHISFHLTEGGYTDRSRYWYQLMQFKVQNSVFSYRTQVQLFCLVLLAMFRMRIDVESYLY